jgi:predicted transcriptional regulator
VTGRNRSRTEPSNLEQIVLDYLWAHGPSTAEAVRTGLAPRRVLKDPTIRTLLRRLERKGFIAHREQGRAYIYSVREKRRSVAVRALRQLVDRFCNGSVEELVTGMVEHEVIAPAELRRLARRLEREKEKQP